MCCEFVIATVAEGCRGGGDGNLSESERESKAVEEENWQPVFIALNSFLAHLPASAVSTAPASYAVSKIALAKLVEYVASRTLMYERTMSILGWWRRR